MHGPLFQAGVPPTFLEALQGKCLYSIRPRRILPLVPLGFTLWPGTSRAPDGLVLVCSGRADVYLGGSYICGQ